MTPRHLPYRQRQAQRGASLVVVMIIVLLGLVSIAGAFRVTALSESVIGGGSDRARTLAAAEALLRDAENDIRGRLPSLTGTGALFPTQTGGLLGLPCKTSAPPTGKIHIGCRVADAVPGATNTHAWYPRDVGEYQSLSVVIGAVKATRRCLQGICVPLSLNALDQLYEGALLGEVFPDGAAYGQYTGATVSATAGNASLSRNITATALPGDGEPWSRYWVEVFRYSGGVANGASPTAHLAPDPTAPFVYRITAVAQGRKPGSRVILRQTFVPNPAAHNP
jgi:type IV pilus assembly protein PilX